MKKCIFIVFWAAFMILKSDGSTGDLFLDSIHGTNDSKFGATLSETHISNNNGIQEQHGSSITYGQKSDGSCVERVKSSKNGETKVTELPVECEKVQAEIQKNNEKTQQAIEEQARKLLEEHEKMMEEHWGAEKDEKSEPGKDLEVKLNVT
ncbi:hypothetical protein J6590_064530 [Homalodisca vitripennis]|nr:hypothetical protein J6590_064530 [Homalodisca vitripennis]